MSSLESVREIKEFLGFLNSSEDDEHLVANGGSPLPIVIIAAVSLDDDDDDGCQGDFRKYNESIFNVTAKFVVAKKSYPTRSTSFVTFDTP